MCGERLVGQHLGERRAHRRERQRVARERAADAAPVQVVALVVGLDPLEHGPVTRRRRATGTPAPSDLPIVKMSGVRPQAATQPPGPAEIVCVSSIDSSVPVSRTGLLETLEEARLGQHDADVRERRLGQHAGDVAARERAPHALQVVELDHDGRLGRIDLRPDVARASAPSRRPRRSRRPSRRPSRGSTS